MIHQILSENIVAAIKDLYSLEYQESNLQLQETRSEFEGDITLVVFPLIKALKKSPEIIGNELGEWVVKNTKEATAYQVVKGFLNFSISDEYWLSTFFNYTNDVEGLWNIDATGEKIMVEYSSPNTNKPLHLGHIRNNLLGYSVAEILKANGYDIVKTQIINDRGIHICKSMLGWLKWGDGETPESTGIKGDKFVGKYYVLFDKQYKKEVEELVANGSAKDEAEKNAPSLVEARELLKKWEAKDEEVIHLWQKMNNWVYAGFEYTYKTMGVDFDALYYESNTYLHGKEIVEGNLGGLFYKKEDGSIWINLEEDGLDEKLLVRADGTTVYMTQDIGTAIQRFEDNRDLTKQIYTVGNEQDYHFKVLFLILQKLGYEWAKENYHLSYGMVELPEGRMKTREGTVVDADDIMQEMYNTAKSKTEELGKINDISEEEREKLFWQIGLGALKYFMLKVDPKKKMLFNPEESIDFNGNTGPFIQYTYARIQSILRKNNASFSEANTNLTLQNIERKIIKNVLAFKNVIQEAGKQYSPALIANYIYDLAKDYNQFYQNCPILKEEDTDLKNTRLQLSYHTAAVIKKGMSLLGIEVPNQM